MFNLCNNKSLLKMRAGVKTTLTRYDLAKWKAFLYFRGYLKEEQGEGPRTALSCS